MTVGGKTTRGYSHDTAVSSILTNAQQINTKEKREI